MRGKTVFINLKPILSKFRQKTEPDNWTDGNHKFEKKIIGTTMIEWSFEKATMIDRCACISHVIILKTSLFINYPFRKSGEIS